MAAVDSSLLFTETQCYACLGMSQADLLKLGLLSRISTGTGGGGGGTGLSGAGSPEGAVTASPGTTYLDTTTNFLWVKRTGVASTGWIQITTGAPDAPLAGSGSPEGVQVASPGKPYLDTAAESLWIKKTGVGNTGWIQLIA